MMTLLEGAISISLGVIIVTIIRQWRGEETVWM